MTDTATQDGMTAQGAAGVIYQSGAKILLMKRSPEAVHGGVWGLPAGGIEDGETAQEAAIREFGEETGNPLSAPLTMLNEMNGFTLFRCEGEEFVPTLNEEHTEFVWADTSALPQPLHPGLVAQLGVRARTDAMDWSESARQRSVNGYVTIMRNPISRTGVFKYSGRVIPGADPNRMYNVLRCAEELSRPETLESFKLLPIYDEHEMTGDGYPVSPEVKGIHGSTGEDVVFEGRDVLAPLRIFSRAMRRMIDYKKGLSLGYKCRYEKSAGVFEGMPYDYIQRDILGDHLAVVREGRVGTEVLDHSFAFDHVDLALDEKGDDTMADEMKEKDADVKDADTGETSATEKKEMSMTEISAALTALMPFMEQVKEFMAAGAAAPAASEVLDADEGEETDEDETKGEAMDAAEKTKLNARISGLETTVKKLTGISSPDKLSIVRDVTPVVGTFDHAEMDADAVAKYALDKLGIIGVAAGQERAALTGYLAAHKGATAYAMDSAAKPAVKAGGKLASRLAPTA